MAVNITAIAGAMKYNKYKRPRRRSQTYPIGPTIKTNNVLSTKYDFNGGTPTPGMVHNQNRKLPESCSYRLG